MEHVIDSEEEFLKGIENSLRKPEIQLFKALFMLNEQICKRMEELNMKNKDLASMLRVSPAYISKILNGKPNMTMKTLVDISNCLGMRIVDQILVIKEAESSFLWAGIRDMDNNYERKNCLCEVNYENRTSYSEQPALAS